MCEDIDIKVRGGYIYMDKKKSPAKPAAKKPASKPVAKAATKKPAGKVTAKSGAGKAFAKKPASKQPAKKSAGKQSAKAKAKKPSSKPVTKAVAKKPASKPSAKIASRKPVGKPVRKVVAGKPARKPAVNTAIKKPASKPVTKSVLQKPQVKPEEIRAQILKNSPIFFKAGGDEIAGGEIEKIGKIKALLAKCKSVSIRIEGHTASAGFPESEKRLSLRRAEKVKSLLKGSLAITLQAVGMGATKIDISKASDAEKNNSRRVVIHILSITV
jgi:outer membrane protein OmpA-like peptidoglycan-associated protein